jgi:hypothetical protein
LRTTPIGCGQGQAGAASPGAVDIIRSKFVMNVSLFNGRNLFELSLTTTIFKMKALYSCEVQTRYGVILDVSVPDKFKLVSFTGRTAKDYKSR